MASRLRPRWLTNFAMRIFQALAADPLWSLGGSWAQRRLRRQRCWDLRVAPFRVEVQHAGPADGKVIRPSMFCDLTAVAREFDEWPEITWSVPAKKRRGLRQMTIVFEGIVEGHRTRLCLLAEPLKGPPGLLFDLETRTFRLAPVPRVDPEQRHGK